MTRPFFQPDTYYHIFNRGRSRLSICHDKGDYFDILGKLKKYSEKYQIKVIAYVLLPNHYHFLVYQGDAPRASLLPQRIFNSYGKIYNKKYQHSGTIFEGRAKAIPVKDEGYLLHLCRYIHANPVVHGIVESVDDWPYSNFHEWVGMRNGRLVDRDFIKAYFASPGGYREFVMEYLLERKQPEGMDFLDEW